MTGADRGRPGGRRASVEFADHDRYRWAAPLAVAGGGVALAMAVFGLPPVDFHGPLHYLGMMGPVCGMTRAVRHFARLELSTAMRYNPAVPLVALSGAGVVCRWVYGRITGRWAEIRVHWTPSLVVLVTIAVVALAVRQQAHVDLLR